MTIQLAPEHLGNVQVQIDRTTGGATAIVLRADRPETLSLLQQNHTQLASALDRGGVSADGRTISFHSELPAAEHPSGTSTVQPSPPSGGAQSAGPETQSGGQHHRPPPGLAEFGSQFGQQQSRQQPGPQAQRAVISAPGTDTAESIVVVQNTIVQVRWNTQVNITA